MKNMLLANRYARALFAVAKEANEQDAVFEQMRMILEALAHDQDAENFFNSPLIRPEQKALALEKILTQVAVVPSLKNFMGLMVSKGRFAIFADVFVAYQQITDETHGVTRGTVRSATVLAPEQRKQIETLVSRATKKQVILTYKEDPSLVGGLVAEVGSYTFDDSLVSHLKRMNEQLTRVMN